MGYSDWDDYEENYPDAEEIDSTGIWDTPYSIYRGNGDKDNYPLIKPWIGDGTTDAKVKFRGVIVSENHPTTGYNYKIRIDEILIDPSDVLNSGDVIWVWAFNGGPATVDDVSIGDKVEVYGKYDGELHREVKLETAEHYLKNAEYNPGICLAPFYNHKITQISTRKRIILT